MNLRQNRIADRIRDIVAGILTGERLSDPRLKGVVVTRVKITADMQLASVYFRTYNKNIANEQIIKGLESSKGIFRHKLSDALIMRRVPQLRFFYDESIEKKARIEQLLSQIKREE